MTLTPEQRYTAYCIMLAEAEKRPLYSCGFCALIKQLFGVSPFDGRLKRMFPELAAKEPAQWGALLHWFDTYSSGWQQRCAILREVITEMEKKLYT